jgi:hypothetical protein
VLRERLCSRKGDLVTRSQYCWKRSNFTLLEERKGGGGGSLNSVARIMRLALLAWCHANIFTKAKTAHSAIRR